MNRKIVVMYGSIGLGHKVISENIATALREFPEIEVKLLDVLEMYRGPLTESSTRFYEWMIDHAPWLWGFFYTNRVFQSLTLPLRLPFAALKAGKMAAYLEKEKPNLVVTAHPNATGLVAYLKKKQIYKGPLVTTFSDFHFQPYWVFPHVDRYLVMTQEQCSEVIRRGFAPQQVIETGLPVEPHFLQHYDDATVCREFGLLRSKPLILVMGGSRGWGVRLENVQELLATDYDIQVAVVTGKNRDLSQKLSALAQVTPRRLKVFPDWSNENVAKLFSVAKILVTKPGGLTIAQALVKTLPMVLVNPLPTMEDLNLKYLLARGAAIYAASSRELRSWVERLLQDQKFCGEIRVRLREIAHPDAASAAARAIIDMLNIK